MQFNKITLQAKDITPLFDFYKGVMELPVSFLDSDTLGLKVGSTDLIFEKSPGEISPFYHFAFNIPSDKFQEVFELFRKKIHLIWIDYYKSFVADFTNWNAKSFYFYDPAGNILEVICRFDLDKSTPLVKTSELFSNISELGIVFSASAFQSEVKDFMEKYSLQFFEKQKPSAHFMVAGNEEGLFIMVPENRNWYPTPGKTSEIFPIKVSFEKAGINYVWKSSATCK